MKRRRKILITVSVLIVLCVLLLLVFPKWTLSAGHAKLLFQMHRSRFESAVTLALEQGTGDGVSVPPGVSDIDLYETRSGCVDFYMGGFGLAPSGGVT